MPLPVLDLVGAVRQQASAGFFIAETFRER
jgi:hypothetical protein